MSGWTIDTLKEHFDELRKTDREALDKANETLDVRLEAMNEFRAQIQGERNTYLRTDVYDQQHSTLEGRVDGVERIQFKLIGGLLLLTFLLPVVTAIVVYMLTRHAIPTK